MHDYRMQLRVKRETLDIKQYEVDERLKFAKNTVNKIEKGHIMNCRIIEKYAEFLGGRLAIEFDKKENN